MDTVGTYKAIVKTLVLEIAAMMPEVEDGIENQVIIDDQRGHYLLFSVGWEGKQWHYASYVHVDVKSNGRVWLQHDGTDLRIAEELSKRGIPKSNIVVGFQPPYARIHMEDYAIN